MGVLGVSLGSCFFGFSTKKIKKVMTVSFAGSWRPQLDPKKPDWVECKGKIHFIA
jgi:hypothetical protein